MTIAAVPAHSAHKIAAGIAYGAGAGALWGLVFLAPEMTRDFTPLQLAIGRYCAYGLIAVALIAPRWSMLTGKIGRREWLALAFLSLTGNVLYYILLSSAVHMGGVAMTSLIIGLLPVTIALIGSRDHGAVPLRTLAPSLLLCTAGVVCIGWQALANPVSGPGSGPVSSAGGHQITGFLCALGALISWTAYAVGNSRCLMRLSTISSHDWNLLIGIMTGAQAMLLIPLTLLTEPMEHMAEAWLRFAVVSIGVAVLASMVGNALWNQMSRLLPLTMAGQMILFETIFALIYGFLWEQRLPTIMEIAAFALVVTGVLSCIAVHQRRREQA